MVNGVRRQGAFPRYRSSQPIGRWVVIIALLLAVFAALRYSDQPSLAFSLYALIPILLSVFWFELSGGLLTAGAAMLSFLVDELLSPTPELAGANLGLATFNRSVVFFGVAVLVTMLLRRERALAVQVRAQQEELAELESLRAALTPSHVPARPDLQLATAFTPADGLVAGDFYLVVEGAADSTTIVVGDVVGHGLEAARCAAFVRAALATFARFTSDPVQLLELANAALVERGDGQTHFVTAVCLNIGAPPHRAVRWAAAGHDAPWYLDTGASLPGGRVGAPLGVEADTLKVELGGASLAPGAGILVFTDGLTEGRPARRPQAGPLELFGEERARRIVQEQRGSPPDRVLTALVSAVSSFAGGSLADDLCLVAVRAHLPAAEAG
ncbi:MAG TPA: PP2C family protein-serine/threonine phosphatase [Geodermatophilus sp.]|nr:PP2C family protein-serine/threonine phosphatase [Geodermatophilus sp.]